MEKINGYRIFTNSTAAGLASTVNSNIGTWKPFGSPFTDIDSKGKTNFNQAAVSYGK